MKNLDRIINGLPEPLKTVVNQMETMEEKKMALYASTVIAGSIMPHGWINYDNKINHPALMLLISYPPASGKGKLALLIKLVDAIATEQQELNRAAMKKYRTSMRHFEKSLRKGEEAVIPEKPPTPLLVIPANTTSAKLTEQLSENCGQMMALLFETETDALTNMMGNRFGVDNSMILRKVYHHETISQMRKTNDEHLEVRKPKMAIVVTGTPSQIPKLFHSVRDGLFSRFMIVTGGSPVVWKDVDPCDGCHPLDEKFAELASEFHRIYHFFKSKKVEVRFTEYQWTCLNNMGKIWLTESVEQGGEYAVSISKRHGNMIARVAVILTLLRYYNEGSSAEMVYCADYDYNTAQAIVEHSFENSLELFKQMPGEEIPMIKELTEFFDYLPMEFQTKEIVPLEKTLGVSKRTVERMLKRLLDMKWIEQIKKGKYRKVDMTGLSDVSDLTDDGINI